MIRVRPAGWAAVLLAVTTAGCGPSAQEQRAVDSLTKVMSTGINFDNSRLFGPDYPPCFAEELVADAGLDALVEDGVVDTEGNATSDLNTSLLSEETAEAYAAAEYACIDFGQMARYLQQSGELRPASRSQVDTYVDCLSEIDPDQWRENSRDQALSKVETEAVSAFGELVTGCREEARLP